MGRPKKWLKMNETITSIEEWNLIYSKLKNTIETSGLKYTDKFDDKHWFYVQVYYQKISRGWNSLSYGYSKVNNSVKNAFERYGSLRLNLKVSINLETWEQESLNI